MKKIAHEAPISIFDAVQARTDYDYALVHLFEESDQYFNLFKQSLKKKREVILDNSIFELGTAFDPEKYAEWIVKLQPTYYIIPDVLNDAKGTIENFDNWIKNYKDSVPGKIIAVAQGKTFNEFLECYNHLTAHVDKIAISFDSEFYNMWISRFPTKQPTKYHEWAIARQLLFVQMVERDLIKKNIPHHLLGCGVPQEFINYHNYDFIDSIDTSNPVVAGLKGLRYNELLGLDDKPSEKLFTLINSEVSPNQMATITHNVTWFRKIVNGE